MHAEPNLPNVKNIEEIWNQFDLLDKATRNSEAQFEYALTARKMLNKLLRQNNLDTTAENFAKLGWLRYAKYHPEGSDAFATE